MFDGEIEQRWRIVKESFPEAVVFQATDGLYVVGGSDTEVLTREFRIGPGSRWYGFDEDQAWAYMSELAKRGYAVVRATNGRVSPVEAPVDCRREVERQRNKATFVAVDPLLLLDRRELENDSAQSWLRRNRYEELFELFKRWLREDDMRSLRGHGEPYIYRVGEWYELDHELTSMLDSHVLLLARAAHATASKMPCKLVEPPLRRNRHRKGATPAASDDSTSLGQMHFEGFG